MGRTVRVRFRVPSGGPPWRETEAAAVQPTSQGASGRGVALVWGGRRAVRPPALVLCLFFAFVHFDSPLTVVTTVL